MTFLNSLFLLFGCAVFGAIILGGLSYFIPIHELHGFWFWALIATTVCPGPFLFALALQRLNR